MLFLSLDKNAWDFRMPYAESLVSQQTMRFLCVALLRTFYS
jgi:hypothetical protein